MRALRRRGERGATALEFGLVAPMLMVLVFGLIQYGYLFWSLTTASANAREAARKLVVGQDWDACIKPKVEEHAGQPALSAVDVTYRWTDSAGATLSRPVQRGDYVEVTVAFDTLDLGIPLLPVPGGGTVSQSATRQVENVPDSAPACDNPGTY